jgi:glycosyltransferase involved in cell wall biosynthesis
VSRIAVIGPVEPFRSGVARHTTALARALARRPGHEVHVYSFSRQYPALLFPGSSDRSPAYRKPSDVDVDFLIDSINPLTWWQTCRALRRFDPELVVAPMWTFFLAPCTSLILSSLSCPIVGVVHNVADHDANRAVALISSILIRRAGAYVTHTRELAQSILRLVPGAQVIVHPHPVFDYPIARRTLIPRADLELLMFGLLRPYKGVDVLLDALARCRTKSVMLSIVGESWLSETELRHSIARRGLADRVELVLRYVADDEAAEYFARADVVVLPYLSVTGSGVLPLALHYGKPVAASDLPGFRELVTDAENGWLVPPGDAAALAETLETRVSREAAAAMGPAIAAARQRLSFDHFADAVLEAAPRPLGPRPAALR